MDASTVYTIAKALPDKERAKLYDMLKAEQKPQSQIAGAVGIGILDRIKEQLAG